MTTQIEKENFVIDLTDKCQSHEQWLAVVRFGLNSLLEDQPLFAEVLYREAPREAEKIPGHKPSDHIGGILTELKLRLVVED